MIFSELYSAYYAAVAAVLRAACGHPVSRQEVHTIITEHAFEESALAIEPALWNEAWPLLFPDGTTPIGHPPSMPLTTLQKRWLKAISLDPRVRLFGDEFPDLDDVKPLFTPDDVRVFDAYLDGDPYEDEAYIRHFRTILKAIEEKTPLAIETLTHKGYSLKQNVMPENLEYSQKDDKFRLIASGNRRGVVINVARIISCLPAENPMLITGHADSGAGKRTVSIEIYDERNALERVLMHFAHFEKQVERMNENTYLARITYDLHDETEMVIRILSFGPMVKAVAPERLVKQIRERLARQRSL